MIVAYGLARTNMALLIGRQADPRLVRAIGEKLAEQPEVERSSTCSRCSPAPTRCSSAPGWTSLSLRRPTTSSSTCIRIDNTLREEFTDVDEVFLEPVPRNDPELRERVRARYREADLREIAPE